MSSKDALMFPLVASCVLFGLYILFRIFSKEYINLLLTAYFLLFGIGGLTQTLSQFFSLFLPKTNESSLNVRIPFGNFFYFFLFYFYFYFFYFLFYFYFIFFLILLFIIY